MKHKKKDQATFIGEKDYSKKVYFSPSDFQDNSHLLQVVTIPPHTKQRLHYHKVQNEVSYILEGEALFVCNDKEIEATSRDTFICEPGDRHCIWNKSDKDFKLVVFKTDFPQEEDTVWLEE